MGLTQPAEWCIESMSKADARGIVQAAILHEAVERVAAADDLRRTTHELAHANRLIDAMTRTGTLRLVLS